MSEAKQSSSQRDFLEMAASFAADAVVAGAAVAAVQPAKGPAVTETMTTTVTEAEPIVASCDINAFRAHVEQETKVGPFWSEVLYDRKIKFGPKR